MSSYVRQASETISQDQRSLVVKWHEIITKASNSEFWNGISEAQYSLYVGSYGLLIQAIWMFCLRRLRR